MARSTTLDAAAGSRGSIVSCLSAYRFGTHDPTTRLGHGDFWRATYTPLGPATVRIVWDTGVPDAEAWGPGREWLLDRVEAMVGALDPGYEFADAHPLIMRAQHLHPPVHFGASHTLYHELLPTIIGQRITAGEAIRQWHALCVRIGEPAPGPQVGLLLPPAPQSISGRPAWWFHPLGIEAKRANALRTIARHADRLWDWVQLLPADAASRLAQLPGIGQWTIGSVLGSAMADPDAIAVGDYHLKNIVSYNLAGEARGTDERMLQLLAPYVGQRGRAVRLLQMEGRMPPKFGPRRRILPVATW